jgi:hypothetical protein
MFSKKKFSVSRETATTATAESPQNFTKLEFHQFTFSKNRPFVTNIVGLLA